MKQFFSFFIILMAAFIAPQRSAAQGSFAIDDVTVIPGGTTTIEVKYVANGSETQGVQFKVEIPAGLSFVEGSWNFGPAISADNFTMGNHDIFRDGTCIFFSIANSGSKMYVPDGVILTFDVACDEDLAWEENTIKVFDPFVGVDIEGFDVPVVRGSAFTLENGMFLRIKADDSHYLCMPGADAEDDYLTFDGNGTERGSIFYWDGSTLLSYENGMYVTKDDDYYLVGSSEAGDNVEFKMTQQGNKFIVSYIVAINKKTGKPTYRYITFDEEIGVDAATDASDATPLTFEAVEMLPVTTNASGYVTLYSPVALTVPEGVKAYTAIYDAERAAVLLTETATVPAACGVIVEAEDFASHTFDFALSEEDAAPAGDLTGSFASVEAIDGAFTLQCVGDVIGFYPYTGETLSGFKAYLTEVAANSARMIKVDNLTAINGTITSTTENANIYDLQGRRVMTKVRNNGLYITNGKKLVK